jgi:hypothetical protein
LNQDNVTVKPTPGRPWQNVALFVWRPTDLGYVQQKQE